MSIELFKNDNYIQIIFCLQLKKFPKIGFPVLAGRVTYVKIQKKLNSLIYVISLYIHLITINGVNLNKKVSKSRQIMGALGGYIRA